MLDRNKQTNPLQPQQVFSDWLEGLQKLGGVEAPQNWQEAIDFFERQINGAIDVQVKTMKTVIANVQGAPGVSEPFAQWYQRLDQSIELWSGMQQRLWEVWFEMLRSTTTMMQNPGASVMGNFQEMMDQAASMQDQLFTQWTGMQKASPAAARKSTAKSAAPRKSSGSVSGEKTGVK